MSIEEQVGIVKKSSKSSVALYQYQKGRKTKGMQCILGSMGKLGTSLAAQHPRVV